MKLYELSVGRPVATAMLFTAIIVFGAYSFTRLPVDLFPDFEVPVITVITSYPGASAIDIEQNVTRELETALSTISNLDEIYSESIDNASVITLTFDWEANMLEVVSDVRDAINRAQMFLPEGIDDPFIQKFDTGAIPVMGISAVADDSFYDLENLLDDEVIAPLNRISGVGAVVMFGVPEQQVKVLIDPVKLEAYNLDIDRVTQLIRSENIAVPAGQLDLGVSSYNLRTNSEFASEEEIGNIVVTHNEGQAVYLDEVATVTSGFKEETSIGRVDGSRGVILLASKQADANTVTVANEIQKQLPTLQERLPADVELIVLFDTSEFINQAINNLSMVLFFALMFVILIVFAFLHRWRATLIIAVTIPVSLLVGLIYLALTGSSLNIISLTSLAIALGMVVDDAIVVLENVIRRIEAGDKPKAGAIRGTREVFTAVIASTLTVVSVFLPLTFISGMMGIWFQELGFIVVVTVVTSTVSALMLTPMLASVMIKHIDKKKNPGMLFKSYVTHFARNFSTLEEKYAQAIRWSLHRRKRVVAGAILIFGSSIALIPLIGFEFMPVSDNSQITMEAELATGRNLDFTEEVIRDLETMFKTEVPEMDNYAIQAGGTGFAGTQPGFVVNIIMGLVGISERDRSIFEIAEVMREKLAEIPEIRRFEVNAGGGGPGGVRPVEINILGRDLTTTSVIADNLMEQLENIEGIRDIRSSRGDDRTEFEVRLDREKLAGSGMNSSMVSNAVRGSMDGLTTSQFRRAGNEYDIIVRYRDEDRHSLSSVEHISMMTPSGQKVRVGDVGQIREFRTPPNIERFNRERVVTVTSGLTGRPLSEVVDEIDLVLADIELPAGVEIQYGGDIEDLEEAFSDLFLILIISLILVYIVMAGQFESFRDPLVIMFSIPFAMTGVLLAALLTGTALSVIGMLGAVILVGIVVKNAIVLIDYIRLLQSNGMEVLESIIEAGKLRLRPVLMTTFTTILAMLPLALALGEGAELWSPMAISVIGGLAFSTLITLGLIPVMYAIFNRKRIKAQ